MTSLENKMYTEAYNCNHLESGKLRIATILAGTNMFFPYIIPIFKEKYPNISIQIIENDPFEIEKLLLNNVVDFATLFETFTITLPYFSTAITLYSGCAFANSQAN